MDQLPDLASVAVVDAANSIRSGFVKIYPGSHELRPISIIPLEHDLVPEGVLVLASLTKIQEPQAPEPVRTPAQTLGLLSEVAAAISRQVQRSKEVQAMLGHGN